MNNYPLMNQMPGSLAVPAIERVVVGVGVGACAYLVGKVIDKCDAIKLKIGMPGGIYASVVGHSRGKK